MEGLFELRAVEMNLPALAIGFPEKAELHPRRNLYIFPLALPI